MTGTADTNDCFEQRDQSAVSAVPVTSVFPKIYSVFHFRQHKTFTMNLLQKKGLPVLALLTALTSAFSQNLPGGFHFNLPEFDGTNQTFLPTFPAYTIGECPPGLHSRWPTRKAGRYVRWCWAKKMW